MLLRIRVALLAGVAIAFAASVQNGGATSARAAAATIREHSWVLPAAMHQAKSSGLLFVADTDNNVVDIFPLKKPSSPIGQIKGLLSLPSALAVDGSGNLFVYNSRTNSILEFTPPYTHAPLKTFYDGVSDVLSITVDAAGTIYTADYYTVVEFLHGESRGTIVSLPVSPTGVTLDSRGELVCAFDGNGAAGVLLLTHGSPLPKNLLIPLETGAADVLFDSMGNLLVEDTGGAYINIYAPGTRKPSKKITSGFISPEHMAFSSDKQTLYVADYGNGSASGTVTALTYPSGSVEWRLSDFAKDSPQGIAVSPAAIP